MSDIEKNSEKMMQPDHGENGPTYGQRNMSTGVTLNGMDSGYRSEDMMERVRTASSVTIPPELFEQMFLSPENKVKGDLRQTFANPTGIAIGGFLLCTTPLSMVLLGWQGAGGLGAANVGTYFWFGGMLLTLGGLLEWVMGNTFPCTVFTTFGAFWFTFGSTLTPSFNAYGAYETAAHPTGLDNPQFYSTFSFFLVGMVLLCFVFLIASIRTNICFFILFITLVPTFSCLAAAFFALGQGNAAGAAMFQKVGAGLLLGLTMVGWYIFLALMLLAVDFPFMIPLGDLSTVIKGRTEREKAKKKEY